MDNHNYCLILAGGNGSRLWPVSRSHRPKQFIDFFGTGRSLLQQTFDRVSQFMPLDHIYVSTNVDYLPLVYEQLPQIDDEHILEEPIRRGTLASVAWSTVVVAKRDPQACLLVTPADQLILNEPQFQHDMTDALGFAVRKEGIVITGIAPTRPETGYGYIQADLSTSSPRNKEIFRVDRFREKPNLETAQKYIQESNFFWNAGIFLWNVETIVNAFRVYQPSLSKVFEGMLDILGTPQEQETVDRLYPECENISVDYAIMEKAEEIFVCPADFGWSDLGTWGSLHEQTPRDLYGNACIGQNIKMIESHNCIIHATGQKKVVVQGLDGYIVAEKDGTLLICKLSEEQRIASFHD